MSNATPNSSVTSAELKAALDDWKEKEKRFTQAATDKANYSESSLDEAAKAAEDAFRVAHDLLRQAAQAEPDESCAAVLDDGSHVVVIHETGEQPGDERTKLLHVPASKVAKLP